MSSVIQFCECLHNLTRNNCTGTSFLYFQDGLHVNIYTFFFVVMPLFVLQDWKSIFETAVCIQIYNDCNLNPKSYSYYQLTYKGPPPYFAIKYMFITLHEFRLCCKFPFIYMCVRYLSYAITALP